MGNERSNKFTFGLNRGRDEQCGFSLTLANSSLWCRFVSPRICYAIGQEIGVRKFFSGVICGAIRQRISAFLPTLSVLLSPQ